jgi:hypothetical protein
MTSKGRFLGGITAQMGTPVQVTKTHRTYFASRGRRFDRNNSPERRKPMNDFIGFEMSSFPMGAIYESDEDLARVSRLPVVAPNEWAEGLSISSIQRHAGSTFERYQIAALNEALDVAVLIGAKWPPTRRRAGPWC